MRILNICSSLVSYFLGHSVQCAAASQELITIINYYYYYYYKTVCLKWHCRMKFLYKDIKTV